MGQKPREVLPFVKKQKDNYETALNEMSQRVLQEVFDGNKQEFDEAFVDASTEQLLTLMEAVAEAAADSKQKFDINEELHDAMIGVMKQWLDEYKADDEDIVREAYAGFL
jgi:NAD-specific glutamate dehydrogenase